MMEAARTSETSSTTILHGSTSQKTNLNFILDAVRTWNLTQLTSMGRLLYVVFNDSLVPDDGGSTYLWNVVDNYFRRQYIPEDNSELHTRRRENLKSHIYQAVRKLLVGDTQTDRQTERLVIW
jgi:hypothetical protein